MMLLSSVLEKCWPEDQDGHKLDGSISGQTGEAMSSQLQGDQSNHKPSHMRPLYSQSHFFPHSNAHWCVQEGFVKRMSSNVCNGD